MIEKINNINKNNMVNYAIHNSPFYSYFCFLPLFLYHSSCRNARGGGGYSPTLPIRVCAAQRGCDFEDPDLERGIHFSGVF